MRLSIKHLSVALLVISTEIAEAKNLGYHFFSNQLCYQFWTRHHLVTTEYTHAV